MTPTTPRDGHEAPLDPARAIVDPHHHLWDLGGFDDPAGPQPFLLPQMARVVADSGHNVVQTVFVECWTMYRQDGPEELKRVGEVEFANGAAAMSASGRYGACRIAAGIVGSADLGMGAEAARVLDALAAAGNGRLRGVRAYAAYADCGLHGFPPDPTYRELMLDSRFQEGARVVGRHGLSLDIYCMHPQMPEVARLADACPQTTIVLDHFGSPMTFGPFAGRPAEAFADWRAKLAEVALRPNVVVKMGGLGHDPGGAMTAAGGTAGSAELAPLWRPYVETALESFGPQRCMFESNFPPDAHACTYGALWNSFKRIAAGWSEDELHLAFAEVARRVYRLG
jgi:predicted TIM-barrel fold metal-dependent hydrolase